MTMPLTADSFNQGLTPTIAVFNKSTVPLAQWGVDFNKLILALQEYIDKHLVPIWGCPAKLVKTTGFVAGCWAIVFLDNADQPGALAYHDLTPDGFPESKVFVKTILSDKESISVATSHELVEMLVNPPTTHCVNSGARFYAKEAGDPVESLSFPVQGIQMSDFVYPSYFDDFRKPHSVKFDELGKVSQPFEILPGGYQIFFENGQWSQSFGSKAKCMTFAKEDRRMHRSEMLGRKLLCANVKEINLAGHFVS